LNGNGELDPGEPKVGSTTTQNLMGVDGMYLFDNLPLDDYIVDVTDENGELVGYWHSTGEQDPSTNAGNDPMDNSKEDAFAVTIDVGTPDNLNVDFGYYKDPASLGNFVWMDSNQDGIQDDGEMGINGVEVTMMIEYPDGTMITLTDVTETKDGKLGYYEFPNLLLDEDYATGAGMAEADPNGVATTTSTPKYTIKVITVGQDGAGEPLDGKVPTVVDANGAGLQASDAENIAGVNAVPTQGAQNTDPETDETTEANEAQYDFGFTTDLVGIGGTIWADMSMNNNDRNDGEQDSDEPGIGGVKVNLYYDVNGDGMLDGMETTPIAMQTTQPDGTYLFEGLQPGKYQVEVDGMNFMSGQPLFDLPFSSVPTTMTDDDDTDNDDNGINATAPNDPIRTPFFMLMVGNEPNMADEMLTPNQDGSNASARDASTNTTVDLGFQSVVLPVELLYFEAKADGDHIDLNWATASELNNSHFELERSKDAKVFKPIAEIEGQGTTLETSEYIYEDRDVVGGVIYYYRIKQVDIGGTFEYSDIRSAKLNKGDTDWTIYPNPIGGSQRLQVEFYSEASEVTFYLMDIDGKQIMHIEQDVNTSGWQTIDIDVSYLPASTYTLVDEQGNVKQFIKIEK
jgi:hypothetical protein